MVVHLHTRSWYSFLAGGSSPAALVERAAALGQSVLALTDRHGIYGAVHFATACRELGVRPIIGSTINLLPPGETDPQRAGHPVVLLAMNAAGYTGLCRLISLAHLHARPHQLTRDAEHKAADITTLLQSATSESPARLPVGGWVQLDAEELEEAATGRHPIRLEWAQLYGQTEDLILLTGGPDSYLDRLLNHGSFAAARRWLEGLKPLFPGRLYVELATHAQHGDRRRLMRLVELAQSLALPIVATNDVRYAIPSDMPRYDALTCVRLGINVAERHALRPQNDAAYLLDEGELCARIPYPEAWRTTVEIAERCELELLPGEVTPPTALLPTGVDPSTWLRQLCEQGLLERYPDGAAAARAQMEKELDVIIGLDLAEFFLVVHEVVSFARAQGIRCAGRGSAANSIIAYLLHITEVDPIAHKLLFERFLHRGRKGMPDIDVDFDSERRDEVIAWMEARFGVEHAAMTANVNTYRMRSAVRDMMKVLGWDLETINQVTRLLSSHDPLDMLPAWRQEIETITGPAPMLDILFPLVAGLHGCPRHLSLHNGGMVLSRPPLACHTPIQISTNGVRQVQFDKDDVESLGLIKFDVLGLRSLSVVTEALKLHADDTGEVIDLENLPMDDEATFELIRRGQTMSVFQIESPGQWNLLSRVQPRTFDDLVVEVALFRPGPLQGGMVNPYVERRAGREPVSYLHPSLERSLHDTFGVILFQEQVLEVSADFAGLSMEEADKFRSLMSKWRDPGKMEDMRTRFISGAMQTHGVSAELAETVFRQVAAFVGYGFCRSHAAAFARTVYHTAWLKAHVPAAYMAAFMQHMPGFYPISSVLEEVKHLGVPIRPVDVWRSGVRYRVEQGAIRLPLTQVQGLSVEMAETLVRMRDQHSSIWSLRKHIPLPSDVWDALARCGAFDTTPPWVAVQPTAAGGSGESRRQALWQMGIHARDDKPAVLPVADRAMPRRPRRPTRSEHQGTLFGDDLDGSLIPSLDEVDAALATSWDYETMGLSPHHHPVELYRHRLPGVRRIEELYRMAGGENVWVAGVVISSQRPPTAKGMRFLVMEDETGRLPSAVPPPVYDKYARMFRHGALLLRGRIEVAGANYRSLLVQEAWPLVERLANPKPA